jgi:hypothetical protein
MKLQHILPATLLSALALTAPVGAAHADSLIYDGINLFSGAQSFTDSFTLTQAGTLNLTLSNIPWLDTVSDLSGFLSTSSGMIGSTITDGSETLSVGPGTYYAHWFGDAKGTYNMGIVGMAIRFEPGTTSTVGLPMSLVLMLSGLGTLFGWQSRRTTPDPLALA